MEICNQQSEIVMRHIPTFGIPVLYLYSFRDIRVHTYDFFLFVGDKVGVANFFWVNRYVLMRTIQLKFLF